MLNNFLITEYVLAETAYGFQAWTPAKDSFFSTRKQAQAYFDGYKGQKVMNMMQIHEDAIGGTLYNSISSNLN